MKTAWRALALVSLLAGLLPRVLADTPPPVDPLLAEYRLSRGDLEVGRVTVTLESSRDGGYVYETRTETSGLVAMFREDEVVERSEGRWNGEAYLPGRYRYVHRTDDAVREVTIDFDWNKGRATNRVDGSVWSMALPEGTQDKLGQQLVLMGTLARGERKLSLPVADGGSLKTYRYELRGKEMVQTPSGEFLAWKLARRKGNRPSRLTLWCAPALGFLAVRIDRRQDDLVYRMELTRVARPGPAPTP